MRFIQREWEKVSRTDTFRLVPIGDTHIGNAACNEKLLKKVIKDIKDDDSAYWIGMGDYCLSEDTKILTNRGWLDFFEIRRGDLAAVYDGNGQSRFEPILKKWINEPNAPLIHLQSGHIDALVTQDHRIVVNHNINGQWKQYEIVRAKQLLKGKTKHIWRLPVACTAWEGLPPRVNIDWFRLKGWIDTEGSLEQVGNYQRLQIAQSETANGQYVKNITALLKRLGLRPKKSKRKWGVIVWRFNGRDTKYIHSIIGRKGERLDWVMNAPPKYLAAYFEALMDGDGTWSRQCFAQKEKGLVSIFQELCFKLGYRAKVTRRPYDGGWQCHFGKERGTHSLLRSVKKECYDGISWCVTTPSGTIVTRRNDKITVLGNCEFINLHDKRFDPASLASWITTADLTHLATVECNHFLDIVEPIADKCLGLVEGGHEAVIQRRYEQAIYNDIVTGIKLRAGMPEDKPLGLGIYGWLRLRFYRGKKGKNQGSMSLDVNLHHGFTAGRLAGAKALNMERWLWNHAADLVIFGHCHDQQAKVCSVEGVDKAGNLVKTIRKGMYSGTFLETVNEDGPATYAEARGYYPTATGCPQAILRPCAKEQRDRVKVLM